VNFAFTGMITGLWKKKKKRKEGKRKKA